MFRRPTIFRLYRDERSGFAGHSVAARRIVRLHRQRRGNVSLIFIFLGLLFYCGAALVWNTGMTIAARMYVQTVADTAAYSSAVWTTRAVNNVTGTNMLVARNASGFAISMDVISTSVAIPIWWAEWADKMSEECDALLLIPPPVGEALAEACYDYIAAVLLEEFVHYLKFITKALPSALEGLVRFPPRIYELGEYERAWVEATPGAIKEQVEKIRDYYDPVETMFGLAGEKKLEIHLTRPTTDRGEIKPPLVPGNVASILPVTVIRFFRDSGGACTDEEIGWPCDEDFKKIKKGRAVESWWAGSLLAVPAAAGIAGGNHYILPTTTLAFLERAPDDLDDWRDFTVVATAKLERATRGRLMAPGVFTDPIAPDDTVIAYAQAETYNGISGRIHRGISELPGIKDVIEAYPFRVWTTWGWQWQPRLARGDQLHNALEADGELAQWYREIEVHRTTNTDAVALH